MPLLLFHMRYDYQRLDYMYETAKVSHKNGLPPSICQILVDQVRVHAIILTFYYKMIQNDVVQRHIYFWLDRKNKAFLDSIPTQ